MGRHLAAMLFALLGLLPAIAAAGPAEDANAIVDKWIATYSANDLDVLMKLYAPDATLLGFGSPNLSEGTEEIRAYYHGLPSSGFKVKPRVYRTGVLSPEIVVCTGFYDLTVVRGGKSHVVPGRFTMVLQKRDGNWLIVHHHASLRPEAHSE